MKPLQCLAVALMAIGTCMAVPPSVSADAGRAGLDAQSTLPYVLNRPERLQDDLKEVVRDTVIVVHRTDGTSIKGRIYAVRSNRLVLVRSGYFHDHFERIFLRAIDSVEVRGPAPPDASPRDQPTILRGAVFAGTQWRAVTREEQSLFDAAAHDLSGISARGYLLGGFGHLDFRSDPAWHVQETHRRYNPRDAIVSWSVNEPFTGIHRVPGLRSLFVGGKHIYYEFGYRLQGYSNNWIRSYGLGLSFDLLDFERLAFMMRIESREFPTVFAEISWLRRVAIGSATIWTQGFVELQRFRRGGFDDDRHWKQLGEYRSWLRTEFAVDLEQVFPVVGSDWLFLVTGYDWTHSITEVWPSMWGPRPRSYVPPDEHHFWIGMELELAGSRTPRERS